MNYENGIETKALIIRESKKLFFKKGYKNTSIREIAAKTHLSSGALYKHFANKAEILDSIVKPSIDAWWQECEIRLGEFEQALASVKTKTEIRNLIIREDNEDLYNYMSKDMDVWRFVLFNSAGTVYQDFFEKFIQWEFHITLRALNEIDRERKYLTFASEQEIYLIIEGFYKMLLKAFDRDFDEQNRANYFRILSDLYMPFWENIFSINF